MIDVMGRTKEGRIMLVVDDVVRSVPDVEGNIEREMIRDWEAKGNVIPDYIQPVVVPAEISDRQFFQQLAIEGRITQEEALDAVGPGIIPIAMLALIGQLPTQDQFAAKMLIRGATIFERLHPVAGLIEQLYGWSDQQRDDFWLSASQL